MLHLPFLCKIIFFFTWQYWCTVFVRYPVDHEYVAVILLVKILFVWQHILKQKRSLIGSRIIESAAYCNQTLMALLYLYSTQSTSVN